MAVINISASLAGGGGFNTTWYLAYVKAIHYPAKINISATFAGETDLQVVIPPSDVNVFGTTDFVWPGIVTDGGSQVLYRQAAGLEKALADVDAVRLTQTYAELVVDQWDPWRISTTNLPYLAWAMGVNLWEDDWSEEFQRWWVANQWTFKSQRGSRLGLINFVNTVNSTADLTANVVNVIQPPAQFFPGPALTPAEKAAYVARFPQLRLYPYAPRPQLPWLNYLGGFSLDPQGNPIYVKNGRFFGPYFKFYPTNFNAGGLYLRKCTLYEPRTGVETTLTVRTITAVPQPGQAAITFDEITLPANPGNLFYPGKGNKKYLLAKHPITQNLRHAVVLGRLPNTASRIVRIPRDGTLDRTQYQAIFQTIAPDLTPINVRPEWVYQQHPMRKTEFYCGQCLTGKFLPKTNAGQYLYERWYLFDPTRQPDYRAGYIYMGRARFGIPKYTAQAKIEAYFPWPKFYARAGGFIGKGYFFPPPNTKLVDKIRRAVTASMAVRDTVRIDTKVKRVLEIRDLTELDGRFIIGQYLRDSGFGATPTSLVSRSAASQPPQSVVPR